jgi:hypothetical protein
MENWDAPMPDVSEQIRDTERGLRQEERALLVARVKLALLWFPAAVGLSWAKELLLDVRERIAHLRYGIEEDEQYLWKLKTHGTTLALLIFPLEDGDGYDDWLAPEDRYEGGTADA